VKAAKKNGFAVLAVNSTTIVIANHAHFAQLSVNISTAEPILGKRFSRPLTVILLQR
jgi:hypothetical protein